LLILNSNELDQKNQKRKNKGNDSLRHRLFHIITTIEEGDNIVIVTFFIV